MNLISRLVSRPSEQRQLVNLYESWKSDTAESAWGSFTDHAAGGFLGNSVVWAVTATRMLMFSEGRYQWRLPDRTVVDAPNLALLERPWPGGTLRDLLAILELDLTLSGNAYLLRGNRNTLQRLRPDKVQILNDQRVPIGYAFWPDGIGTGMVDVFGLSQVAHYKVYPNPLQQYTGASWLSPLLTEVRADTRMQRHRDKFFQNAATPNLFVQIEQRLTNESREMLTDTLNRRYGGWNNAYKTLVLDQGADVKVIGADFQQMDFVHSQAANENRVAAAAGVPAVIVGLKEGLQSATYSNYGQAMRRFADLTMRPLWGAAAGALETILRAPQPGARLTLDDTHIPALQQDAKDEAEIRSVTAATINALVTNGWTADSAIDAVTSGDWSLLDHTGFLSVQLQEPGETDSASTMEPENAFV